MTNTKSSLIKICFAPTFNNVSKSTIKASYYVSLLEHKGRISKGIFTGVLSREIKATPIPTPFTCFNPSKYNNQGLIHT